MFPSPSNFTLVLFQTAPLLDANSALMRVWIYRGPLIDWFLLALNNCKENPGVRQLASAEMGELDLLHNEASAPSESLLLFHPSAKKSPLHLSILKYTSQSTSSHNGLSTSPSPCR